MKKYFAFSMDADKKCRHLSDSDFREVFCAVFNHLRDGVEPEFDNYLLYDYYEKVLSTPMFYLSKIDGRSETSAENGKKGGRPKKETAPEPVNAGNIINCNGKEIIKRRKKNSILQRLKENPGRYKGMAFEDLCYEFDDIEPYPDRLKELFVEVGFFDKSETA